MVTKHLNLSEDSFFCLFLPHLACENPSSLSRDQPGPPAMEVQSPYH